MSLFSIISFSYADSGKTFPYSSLDKCFSLRVTGINKQVNHLVAVLINIAILQY